jgi:predicted transposase/invertase (TIGR01784 family)
MDETEQYHFRMRRKWLMDREHDMVFSRNEGIEEGRELGRKEGVEEGRELERKKAGAEKIQAVKNLVNSNVPLEIVAESLSLSIEKIREIINQ